MGRPGTLLMAVVMASAALAAGCGGGDDDASATEEWADGVCSAFTTWTESVSSAAESVGEEGSEEPLEDRVDAAVEDVRVATDKLSDDLESLGPPDTEAGAQAEQSLNTLADGLKKNVQTIAESAEAASGASGTLGAVSTISGAISTMATQVSTTLDALEQLDPAGELADAFEQADSCESLRQ
jgi:hypothetical protein